MDILRKNQLKICQLTNEPGDFYMSAKVVWIQIFSGGASTLVGNMNIFNWLKFGRKTLCKVYLYRLHIRRIR